MRTKHDELIFVGRQQGAGTEGRIFRQPAALPIFEPKPVRVQDRSMHRKVRVGAASIAVAEAHSALGANGIQCMIMNQACTVRILSRVGRDSRGAGIRSYRTLPKNVVACLLRQTSSLTPAGSTLPEPRKSELTSAGTRQACRWLVSVHDRLPAAGV